VRGTVAKLIRKRVYGDMYSGPKDRKYDSNGRAKGLRRVYQDLKRRYKSHGHKSLYI